MMSERQAKYKDRIFIELRQLFVTTLFWKRKEKI